MKHNVMRLSTLVAAFLLSGCSLMSGVTGGSKVKSKEEAVEAMGQLGSDSGYEITMQYVDDDSSGEFTTGQKGNIYWAYSSDADGEDKGAYVMNEDKSYKYDFENGEWVYGGETDVTPEQVNQAFNGYLYYAQGAAGLKKSGTETVCGRTCDTYKFSLGGLLAVVGAKIEYSVAVDQELGITLRVDVAGGQGEDAGSVSIKTISFKTGSQVVAPNLPAPTPDAE